MTKLIILKFDTNDADYVTVVIKDKDHSYVHKLSRIWKQIKTISEDDRIFRVNDDKYNLTHFCTYSDNTEIHLEKADLEFFADILPYGSECGVSLSYFYVYDYSTYREVTL